MTNVISFAPRKFSSRGPARFSALATTFATARRFTEDVYWLKENAELLNILQATQTQVPCDALDAYKPFHDNVLERLSFFPQYYRFLLGITLDLEDLGLQGDLGDVMCAQIRDRNLVAAELSDLQRGEAMRLLARRGVTVNGADELQERLRRFAANTPTFAVPNRKAAYELTHIIFYLSDYGRKDPLLCSLMTRSLMFTGIMALLEQNIDLLAEVCISLRFGGVPVPPAWDAAVAATHAGFRMTPGQSGQADDYHCYLMVNWSRAQTGDEIFAGVHEGGATGFYADQTPLGALAAMSLALYDLGAARVGDWTAQREPLFARLPDAIAAHVESVSASCAEFDLFFEDFARADTPPLTSGMASPQLVALS